MGEPYLTFERSPETGPFRQGELLSGVGQYIVKTPEDGTSGVSVELKQHPLALILTQDCDLAQDFAGRIDEDPERLRSRIPNILLCEADDADKMRISVKANSEMWRRMQRNNEDRYQYLRAVATEEDALTQGIASIGLDFKRVFTVPTENLYSQLTHLAKRRTVLRSPYMEHVCCRYANYLSRIALPKDHHQS